VSGKEQKQTIWIAVILALGTVLLYWPAGKFEFINLDDDIYVFNNPHVVGGFSWPAFWWSFQAGYASYWHPLTWMSHMLDCQLFGLNPGPQHMVNVFLHAANSALLFVALKRMTRAFWRSAMVAALFAWHPLRVESVAWIAERKDVLSALFWMLSLWAYVRYVEALNIRSPKFKGFYGAALILFALGLMAKPTVITLPCALLLLDWWPLGRLRTEEFRACSRLILEKLPFFILSAASAVLTTIAASNGGAVASTKFVPFGIRISNAVVSYLHYVEKQFWPSNLSVIYPLDFKLPASEIILTVGVLVGITVAVLVFRKRCPYGLVGWLWFVGTLFPVIGLVQVGAQSMADRFTYIPSIGIFIIVCWAAGDLIRRWRSRAAFVAVLAAGVLAGCAVQTHAQLRYWRNSASLFQHALAIDPNNYMALGCYGCCLRDLGQLQQAENELQRAIEISPIYIVGYTFLSGVLETEGKKDDAMKVLQKGLKIRPDFSGARCELAGLLFEENRYLEAQSELEDGLKLDPTDAGLHLYLGYALVRELKYDTAEEQFADSARLAPSDPVGHFQWALALAAQNKTGDAIAEYRATLRIQPNFTNALNNLAWLLASSPDPQFRDGVQAVELASRACVLTHTNEAIKIETLANAYAARGRFDEAVAWAQKASEVALLHGQTNIAEQNLELEKLYKSGRPFYQFQ
jgi:tetratricopeptide (TPR) repeat protein